VHQRHLVYLGRSVHQGPAGPSQSHSMAAPEAMRLFLKEEVAGDLTYIWDEATMPLLLQYDIGQLYRSVRLFASMADDRPEVRGMHGDFNLPINAVDAATKATAKSQMAMVISAWECAKEFVQKETALRAEAKVLQVARPVGFQERRAMKKAVEDVFGKMPSWLTPDPDYLSKKLEEVEQDDPHASLLDELISMDDGQAESLSSSIDTSGRVKITKTKAKGRMPVNSEEYRMKMRLEANLWQMVSTKCRNKVFLTDLSPKVFEDFCDFILGAKCMRLQVARADGTSAPLDPPWHLLLSFEYALRKEAFRRIRDNECLSIAVALLQVTKDSELKEIHFTSPLALGNIARPKRMAEPSSNSGGNDDDSSKDPMKKKGRHKKGNGKGGGGGKGSKGGKSAGKGLSSATPDGKRICYAFNDQGCTSAGCTFLHVCRRKGCHGNHPANCKTAHP
jgi:hypothetical protein